MVHTVCQGVVFFLMFRPPPRSTRTDTLFPYTTLFRSLRIASAGFGVRRGRLPPSTEDAWPGIAQDWEPRAEGQNPEPGKIGRAHVCTPVTNAHLVCRLLLEKQNKYDTPYTRSITEELHHVCDT